MPDDPRPDPDALLALIQKADDCQKRGKLKVFLGMAPGVGKTFAMLEAARREQATGRDVVIGYVETHGRKETDALAEGLPKIPRRSVEYRGVTLTEMDLDAVLARKPELALVDELAHTNAPGSRHPKRYQDVRAYLQRRHITGPWKSGQRLLDAISPSPLSEPMARWTRRLADNLQAPWLAVYVDTGHPLAEAEETRLQQNLALARELGAEVITTTDQDIVSALLRVARQHNVTQIVVGKPDGFRVLDLFRGGSMLSRLIRESGNIDVHCVRAEAGGAPPRRPRFRRFT